MGQKQGDDVGVGIFYGVVQWRFVLCILGRVEEKKGMLDSLMVLWNCVYVLCQVAVGGCALD